jgi:hypothetical protein
VAVTFDDGAVYRGVVTGCCRAGRYAGQIHILYDDNDSEWARYPDAAIVVEAGARAEGGAGGTACESKRQRTDGSTSEAQLLQLEQLPPRHLVGCLVFKEGSGGGLGAQGGSGAGRMRGVIEGRVAQPARAAALFRVQYADGTEELVEGGRLPAMLVDAGSAGTGASNCDSHEGGDVDGDGDGGSGARCPVCFDGFGTEGVTPAIFACGHVLCTACIQCICAHSAADAGASGTTRRGTCIRCPLCQTRHRVGGSGAGTRL